MSAINKEPSFGEPYDPNNPEQLSFQADGQELRLQGEALASSGENSNGLQAPKAHGFWEFIVITGIPFVTAAATAIANNITNLHLGSGSKPADGNTQLLGHSGVKRWDRGPVVWPIPPAAANRGDTQLSGSPRVKRGAPVNGSIPPAKVLLKWKYIKNQPGVCSSTKVIAKCEKYVEMESNLGVGVDFVPVNANKILNNRIKIGFDVWCLCGPKNFSEFKIVPPSGSPREMIYAHPSLQPDECKTQAVLTQCLNELSQVAETVNYYLITHKGHECHCPPPIAPYDVRYVVVDSAVQLRIMAQPTDQSTRPEWVSTKNQPGVCFLTKVIAKCKEIIKGNEQLIAVNANYVLYGQLSSDDIMCLCAPKDPDKVEIVLPSGFKKVKSYFYRFHADACKTAAAVAKCHAFFASSGVIVSFKVVGEGEFNDWCECAPPTAPYDTEYEVEDGRAGLRFIAQPADKNITAEWVSTKNQPKVCFILEIINKCKELIKNNMKSAAVNADYVLNKIRGGYGVWCLCAPVDPGKVKIIPPSRPRKVAKFKSPPSQPGVCKTEAFLARCANETGMVTKIIGSYSLSTAEGNQCYCPPPIAPYDLEYRILVDNSPSVGGGKEPEVVGTTHRLPEEMSAFTDTDATSIATEVTSGAGQSTPLRSSLPGIGLLIIGRLLRPVGLV